MDEQHPPKLHSCFSPQFSTQSLLMCRSEPSPKQTIIIILRSYPVRPKAITPSSAASLPAKAVSRMPAPRHSCKSKAVRSVQAASQPQFGVQVMLMLLCYTGCTLQPAPGSRGKLACTSLLCSELASFELSPSDAAASWGNRYSRDHYLPSTTR